MIDKYTSMHSRERTQLWIDTREGHLIRIRELIFFFQAEDGIRDLVRSRELGDVYKRQCSASHLTASLRPTAAANVEMAGKVMGRRWGEVAPAPRRGAE